MIGIAGMIATGPACSFVAPADAADFYQGKQLRLIVSTPASGAYDGFARLIAPYLADHIPGRPVVVVENLGGSAGMQAANYLAHGAPADGTVIGAVQNNIPTAPLLTPEIAKFGTDTFLWIGSVSSDPFIGYVWNTSKLVTFDDAKKTQFVMGTPAVRSFSAQMAQISNTLFGTKFKIVIGYNGSNEVKLAMERGEIDGTFGNSWSSLKTQDPDWISDHKVRIITQFGLKPDPELADVPMFLDQAKSEEDRQLLALLQVQQIFAKPYLAPPGVPSDRLAILRNAFDEAVNDPKFRATLKALNLDIKDPLNGQELASLVARVSKTSPTIVERAKNILDNPQAGEKP